MLNAQILVVEDEPIIARDIQSILKRLGYGVSAVVSSGEEAIKKAAETIPDLVLMDIVLEGAIDGVEAAEDIRDHFDIPVVYLTAYSDEKTLHRTKITEPYGYILKPFQEKELHTTIEIALYKHKMERELRESKQWFATTLKSIGDAVIATDTNGFITYINPIAEALTGWKHVEAVGKPLTEVFNIINEETGKQAEDPAIKILSKGVVVGLANHTVLISKGGTKRPIDDSGAPIRDDKGNITGVVLTFRDITERKQAEDALKEYSERLQEMVEERTKELQEAHEQLVRKERLAILGELAGGVGHELRNPLGVISNAVYYLQMTLTDADKTTKEYLEIISSEVRNAEEVISDLLAFSRVRPAEREQTEVLGLVARVLEKRSPTEEVKVITSIAPDLPPVFVDPRQIGDVLVNLVTNAHQAMPEGGKLTISAHAEKGHVQLSIIDTGCGIPEENMEKIFEPLFTTRARGIGLGLSVSKNLVEANEGSIKVESEEGKGSTFTVILPTREALS